MGRQLRQKVGMEAATPEDSESEEEEGVDAAGAAEPAGYSND